MSPLEKSNAADSTARRRPAPASGVRRTEARSEASAAEPAAMTRTPDFGAAVSAKLTGRRKVAEDQAAVSADDAEALGAARAGAGARTGTTRARLRPARARGRNGVMKGP